MNTIKFKVTSAEDGLVIWPAATSLVKDRDNTYFDEDCKARGDVCGYDMYEILSGLLPGTRSLPDGIYEIEVGLINFTKK